TVLPYYGFVALPNLDDPLVALVSDQYVSAWKECVLDWGIELVESEPGDSEDAILPDYVAALVDEENPVVYTAALTVCRSSRRYPCAGHQCEAPDTLSVVRSDDCIGRGISRTVPELPDDTAVWGYFDDSVVELVGDENVAWLVKLGIGGYSLCLGWKDAIGGYG